MPTLYIPKLRDKLVLIADWTFPVHFEHRNEALMAYMGYGYESDKRDVWLQKLKPYERFRSPALPELFTITAGTELSIDRVFIRNGAAGFDSITFRCGLPPKPKTKRSKPVPVRFWVKLEAANGLEFDHPAPAAKP